MDDAVGVLAAASSSSSARETSNQKDLFDHISMSMVSYLELYDEVTKVDVQAKGNKNCKNEILLWEKTNFPYKIPNDMKDFYLTFNGVKVTWKVNIAGKHCIIGDFSLLPIEEIERIPMEGTFFQLADRELLDPKTSAAYIIDNLSTLDYGRVALVYRKDVVTPLSSSGADDPHPISVTDGLKVKSLSLAYDEPEVWMQDTSSRWYFVAPSFIQYFRVAVSHLGIIGWQKAFTPSGLPTTTKQWMAMFCQERLLIDLENQPMEM